MIQKTTCSPSFGSWQKISTKARVELVHDRLARFDTIGKLVKKTSGVRVPGCDTVISPQGDIFVNVQNGKVKTYRKMAKEVLESAKKTTGDPKLELQKATRNDLVQARIIR